MNHLSATTAELKESVGAPLWWRRRHVKNQMWNV